MDPRRVLTFRAVAHERSFSAAARALSLTQPAVSQQVAALEKEVGARLLDRENAMALTPAGEILLAHADAIAERFAARRAAAGGADRAGPAADRRVPQRARGARAESRGADRRGVAGGGLDARARRARPARRAAPRRRVPGRGAPAARARRRRARRPRQRAVPGGAPARSSAHGARLDPARGARRRAVGGAERRQPDRPRVPGGGLQPAPGDDLARPARQPRARHAGDRGDAHAPAAGARVQRRGAAPAHGRPAAATSTCCSRPAGATRSPTTRAPPCAK